MSRASVALAFLSWLLSGTPQHRLFLQPNLLRGPSPNAAAVLSFAPPSGEGMGAECAGTVPTTAGGAPVTFARASAAMCTRADGTLVLLSSGQPAVQVCPGCSSGPLGVVDEPEATNTVVRSRAFDDAAWSKAGLPAAPTVTANAGTGPTLASDAERVQFATTDTATNLYSVVFQTGCPGTGVHVASVYVRGYSGSGSVMLLLDNGTLSSATHAVCSFTSSGWSRCYLEGVANSKTRLLVGLSSITDATEAGANRAAADVLLWGADCNELGYLTSHVGPTDGSSARRMGTSWTLPGTGLDNAAGCLSYSWHKQTPAASAAQQETGRATAGSLLRANSSGSCEARLQDGTSTVVTSGGTCSPSHGSTHTVTATWSGSTQTLATDTGGAGSGAFDGDMSVSGGIFLGSSDGVGTSQSVGWWSAVSADTSVSGCQ